MLARLPYSSFESSFYSDSYFCKLVGSVVTTDYPLVWNLETKASSFPLLLVS